MLIKYIFLAVISGSFGLLAAAGVFTVLAAVGLVPRFAGKTHTGRKVILYEEMVIAGTIIGGFVSVFDRYLGPGRWSFGPDGWSFGLGGWDLGPGAIGVPLLAVFGLFAGMFVGCLALAIAEMLDSIPIFSRRIGFRHGMSVVIGAMALGKVCGSLFYFIQGLGEK